MLASKDWQNSHTSTYDGLTKRLELLTEAGLPAMKVISATTLETLGRIPRSNEGYAEDALQAVRSCGRDGYNFSKAMIVFFSHRWKRPNWCPVAEKDLIWGSPERTTAEAAGHIIGDVDDENHSKARTLVQWAKWFKRGLEKGSFSLVTVTQVPAEIYFWIDWPCVDQTNPGPDMAALPAYVAISTAIAAYWNDEYKNRAWCQVELMMAYMFNNTGNYVFKVPERFVYRANNTDVIDLFEYHAILLDPLEGDLTNPNDRTVIENLRRIALESTVFTCWNNFMKTASQGIAFFFLLNVVCFCQFCGLFPLVQKRTFQPGITQIRTITAVNDENLGWTSDF